jgi:hypothetical protein
MGVGKSELIILNKQIMNKIRLGVHRLTYIAFFWVSVGYAQTGVKNQVITNLRPINLKASPLGWYFDKLSRNTDASGTAVVRTKTVGLNKSEVGVNLPRVQQVISPVSPATFNTTASGYCERRNVKMDYLNESAFSLVNLNETFSSIIFPGSFIDAGSLLERRPVFYNRASDRAPLTVSISISNPKSAAPTQLTVSDFGANSINTLHRELRDKHQGAAISPVFAFSLKEITSVEHFTANLNYSAGLMLPLEEFGIPLDLSQGVKATGDASLTKKMHSYVVSFIQPMYAYSVNEVDVNRFFTRPGLAAQHTSAGYVSSVIYGRMALLSFQSTEDSASVGTLISTRMGVSFTGGELANAQLGSRINVDAKANFSTKISNFRAFVYGGDAATALRITSNPEEVFSFIQNTGAYTLSPNSGALPIQYVVQRVSDGRTLGVRSTSSFTVEDCLNPRYDIDVVYKGIKCNKVVEGPFDDEEEIFGSCTVSGKTIFTIPESGRLALKQGQESAADIVTRIKSSLTINDIKNLRLQFASDIKDWELLIKPAYREKQQSDLVFNLESKINQLFSLDPGESVVIDNKKHALSLYEDGRTENASVSVLYQIKITRK